MLFGVDASCHILYSIVSCLYVSCYFCCSGSITLVGEEKANLFAIIYLSLHVCGFCFGEVSSSSWCCIILLWHSLGLRYNYFEQDDLISYISVL